jgi:hypothetical protein
VERLDASTAASVTAKRPSGNPVAIISDSLFTKLRDYADSHDTPLTFVVEQLRDEIHSKMPS